MGILNSEMDRERKQHSDAIARLEERILYLEEECQRLLNAIRLSQKSGEPVPPCFK